MARSAKNSSVSRHVRSPSGRSHHPPRLGRKARKQHRENGRKHQQTDHSRRVPGGSSMRRSRAASSSDSRTAASPGSRPSTKPCKTADRLPVSPRSGVACTIWARSRRVAGPHRQPAHRRRRRSCPSLGTMAHVHLLIDASTSVPTIRATSGGAAPRRRAHHRPVTAGEADPRTCVALAVQDARIRGGDRDCKRSVACPVMNA